MDVHLGAKASRLERQSRPAAGKRDTRQPPFIHRKLRNMTATLMDLSTFEVPSGMLVSIADLKEGSQRASPYRQPPKMFATPWRLVADSPRNTSNTNPARGSSALRSHLTEKMRQQRQPASQSQACPVGLKDGIAMCGSWKDQ